MSVFLKKVKLIQSFSIELNIQKDEFVSLLKEQIDEDNASFISEMLNGTSSAGNEYAGYIGGGYFKLKRQNSSEAIENIAVAEGTYREEGHSVIIMAEISGFRGIVKPMLLFVLLLYPIFIWVFLSSDNTNRANAIPNFPFFLILGLLALGMLFFIMRTSISRLRHKLETELFSLT